MPVKVARISTRQSNISNRYNKLNSKRSIRIGVTQSPKSVYLSSCDRKKSFTSNVDHGCDESVKSFYSSNTCQTNTKIVQDDRLNTVKDSHLSMKKKKKQSVGKYFLIGFLSVALLIAIAAIATSLAFALQPKQNRDTTTITSTTTTSSTSTTVTTTTATTTTATTTTTTTTTSTIACASISTTTRTPGGIGGSSVIYTFDNTSNDLYGMYNAVPVNSPQYVTPGYNGRGAAIQLLAASSQHLTIANFMNFYQRSFTVEAWAYPLSILIGSPYMDSMIYGQTNSSQVGQYMWMMLRNGRIYGAFFGMDVTGPTVLQTNRWYHTAFTYNISTTTQTVYINGVVDGVNPTASPCLITAGLQTIGVYPQAASGYYDGYIDQLQILFNRAKSAQEILDDATLVARYAMDCITYPGWDSGPNQITATAVAVTNSVDGGRVGQAYLFNSTSAYFQATGLVLLGQSYSPYSFSMWLRPIISVIGGSIILHVSADTLGTGWCFTFLGLSSSGQILAVGYSGSIVQVTGPVLTVGHWVHVTETYSQTNGLRLYVNGVLVGQSAAYIYSASGSPMVVTLGQSLNGSSCSRGAIGTNNYRGQIDEFYIYSRELSAADVTVLANP